MNYGNIRFFHDRWIAVREPSATDKQRAADAGLIQVSDNMWLPVGEGIAAFKDHLFGDSIYLISNRFHYEGPQDGDTTARDYTEDWPIFTINYGIEQVPLDEDGYFLPNPVFSFWQDDVPRPKIHDQYYKVFGPLVKAKDDTDNVIRINPLLMGYSKTPKTLHLALTVAQMLGVRYVKIFNANIDHPVNQAVLKEPKFAHLTIDFSRELSIDESIMSPELVDLESGTEVSESDPMERDLFPMK